jgi:6-pyruvoyltetrahydropterin/6-carboxytetrahydropterin synthase
MQPIYSSRTTKAGGGVLDGSRRPPASVRLTARYRFAASHRLHTPALNEEENRRLYGKCSNPHGHGHDYTVDVTVEGAVNADGQVVNRMALDRLVEERVLDRMDHRNLNLDVAEFSAYLVPTTENLATVIQRTLQEHWTLAPSLVRVRISETDRNTFVWEAPRS